MQLPSSYSSNSSFHFPHPSHSPLSLDLEQEKEMYRISSMIKQMWILLLHVGGLPPCMVTPELWDKELYTAWELVALYQKYALGFFHMLNANIAANIGTYTARKWIF